MTPPPLMGSGIWSPLGGRFAPSAGGAPPASEIIDEAEKRGLEDAGIDVQEFEDVVAEIVKE